MPDDALGEDGEVTETRLAVREVWTWWV